MMNEQRKRLRLALIIRHSSFLICLLAPTWLFGQVVRLPDVLPPDDSPTALLVSHPDSSAQILQAPGETDVAPATPSPSEPHLPPGVRNGFFQKILFDGTWLAPGGANGMGMYDVQLQSIFAMPCPTRKCRW